MGFVAVLHLMDDAEPVLFVQRHDELGQRLVGDARPELTVNWFLVLFPRMKNSLLGFWHRPFIPGNQIEHRPILIDHQQKASGTCLVLSNS